MDTGVRKGQRYRAKGSVPVKGLTHWRAPFTGGFSGRLPSGTIVVVSHDPPGHATAAMCLPEDESTEAILVPSGDRSAPKYDGFHLVIPFDELANHFELTEKH